MAEILVSPGIVTTETDQSAVPARPVVAGAALVGPTVKGKVLVPTKVTSYPEYVRTFGTTFTTTHASGSDGMEEQQEFLTSLAAKSYFEQGGDTLLVVRVASQGAFTAAQSTLVESSASAASASFELFTLNTGIQNNNASGSEFDAAYVRSDGSLISGSENNIRVFISNIDEDNGTFSLLIRRGDDTSKEQIILESYSTLSLDPNSPNYIGSVIGDQVETIQFDSDGNPFIGVTGNYPNKSNYIRVKVLKPTPNYLDTSGNPRSEYTGSLPKAQQVLFYGATGEVGMCYSGSTAQTASVATYFEGIKADSPYPQSVRWTDYDVAFQLLSNTDEYQVNVISAPGLLATDQLSQLIGLAENRTDCISVPDLVPFGSSVATVTQQAASQNSSYAATYWPWLQMYSNTGKLVWVPASVVIPGIYKFNDTQAAPWYAPAGMTRGGVQGVIQTEKKLTKADRDKLYLKNVNPIATLPGAGIVVYGQKTLQKKATALDRVNVRRLLIEIKKRVKDLAAGLLFEQNTEALRQSFRAQLDPYLGSIVQRNGLYAYRIDLSGNTSDAIDRNEFHASVILQPTKTIEFIYLNFTVTATGVDFE